MNHFKNLKLTAVAALLLSTSGCVIHVGGTNDDSSFSSVLGDVEIAAGRSVGDISSVNGDVELEHDVTAASINSVNGDIEIANNVTVDSIDVVNGDVEIGQGFNSQYGIESVNGDIEIASGGTVNGSIVTVNGDVELRDSTVNNDIVTTNGDISITRGTVVDGDIVFEKVRKGNSDWNSQPVLRIDASSTVTGRIILNRPVKVDIESAELQEKVEHRYKG
ncbi:hypothetical protein QTP81_04485 [Alteromonas sp. ASW11-36]|uniref:Polymer-forming cytoskeletal protein n=1 Tax=Alteromonas arenosi TaxID=3055817 RepID=A0ABT7SUI6_9ALTE|nr:hypothetical protein [Alteromonas sp. ASW11-36]MDM7859857.1 hypothetical protein [Alteromonas sp. ASW11-36]